MLYSFSFLNGNLSLFVCSFPRCLTMDSVSSVYLLQFKFLIGTTSHDDTRTNSIITTYLIGTFVESNHWWKFCWMFRKHWSGLFVSKLCSNTFIRCVSVDTWYTVKSVLFTTSGVGLLDHRKCRHGQQPGPDSEPYRLIDHNSTGHLLAWAMASNISRYADMLSVSSIYFWRCRRGVVLLEVLV